MTPATKGWTLATIAACVAMTGVVGLMPDEGPPGSVLSKGEAESLKEYFALQSCVERKSVDIEIASIVGTITPEEADWYKRSEIAPLCEEQTGIDADEAYGDYDHLLSRYGGEERLKEVLANSAHLLFRPLSGLTDEEIAFLDLRQNLITCVDEARTGFEEKKEQWSEGLHALLEKEDLTEEDLQDYGPAPDFDEVKGECYTGLGITDRDTYYAQQDAVALKYGKGVLQAKPPYRNGPAPGN